MHAKWGGKNHRESEERSVGRIAANDEVTQVGRYSVAWNPSSK